MHRHRILFDFKKGNLKGAVMSMSLEDILLRGTRQHRGRVYNYTFLRYFFGAERQRQRLRKTK